MTRVALSLGGVAVLAGLAACAASPELGERAAANTADLRRAGSDRTRVSDDAKCQSYGFQPGTAGYADCLSRLRQTRPKARRAADP